MPNIILVVDDDVSYGEAIIAVLESLNLSTGFASCARDAFQAVRRLNPSLILLDIMMPEVDGLTFLRILRSVTSSDVPVIMVSAKCSEEDRAAARRLGADGFLAKPFTVRELHEAIRPFLKEKVSCPQI